MNLSLQVVMRLQFRKRITAELFSRIILPQARELSRKRSTAMQDEASGQFITIEKKDGRN
jgi:hypothetical protein